MKVKRLNGNKNIIGQNIKKFRRAKKKCHNQKYAGNLTY